MSCVTCGQECGCVKPQEMILLVRVDSDGLKEQYRNVGLFTTDEALKTKLSEKIIQYKGHNGNWFPRFEVQSLVVIE